MPDRLKELDRKMVTLAEDFLRLGEDEFLEEVARQGTCLLAKAPKSQLNALEKRINAKLPGKLRQLFKLCSGFMLEPYWNGLGIGTWNPCQINLMAVRDPEGCEVLADLNDDFPQEPDLVPKAGQTYIAHELTDRISRSLALSSTFDTETIIYDLEADLFGWWIGKQGEVTYSESAEDLLELCLEDKTGQLTELKAEQEQTANSSNSKDALVARWLRAADLPAQEPNKDLFFGLFEKFRPSGEGVAQLLEGVLHGPEIASRLMECFEATKEGYQPGEAYSLVRKAIYPPDPIEIARLLTQHHQYTQSIAALMGESELLEVLRGCTTAAIGYHDVDLENYEDSIDAWVSEVISDYVSGLRQQLGSSPESRYPILWLAEAFYSIAADYHLAEHLLWPVFRDKSNIPDPLKPYFELWKLGLRPSILPPEE